VVDKSLYRGMKKERIGERMAGHRKRNEGESIRTQTGAGSKTWWWRDVCERDRELF
jgi:hypothetical protein